MHPAIISSIKDCFFTNARCGSLADKYAARFSSSIKDGPRKDEMELPIPMVCLIATTASLFLSKSSYYLLIQNS
jgi:Domain of unknown function (DUF6532)